MLYCYRTIRRIFTDNARLHHSRNQRGRVDLEPHLDLLRQIFRRVELYCGGGRDRVVEQEGGEEMNEKKEYIERGALIGAIEATEFLTMQDAATTLQLVTEAPAADVEPVVRGEWVDTDYKPEIYQKCSVCGRRKSRYEDNFDRCPDCGAHTERR